MMRRAVVVACACALLFGARAAEAHQSSFAYAEISVADHSVHFELKLSATDLEEALGLPAGQAASSDEILLGAERLLGYTQERIELSFASADCTPDESSVSVEEHQTRYAVVAWSYRCTSTPAQVTLDYVLFLDLDSRHTCFVRVDGSLIQLHYPDDNRLIYRPGEVGPSGIGAMVAAGIDHILSGLDHILFLVVILIAVPLTRESAELKVRPVGATLKSAAVVVTAFTVAHSFTLALASLGWIDLDPRFVESIIALSIVFVALENIVRPGATGRVAVVFVFGLVHGLGFATLLRQLLPPDDVLLPLVGFNLGVEVGQLLAVGVCLPVLLTIASRLGPQRYQRRLVPLAAVAVAALGLIWLFERALQVDLIPL